MTGNLFFDAVIIFLIAYAIVNICYEIGDFYTRRYSKRHVNTCIVLPLRHGADDLEYDIRIALSRSEDARCALVIIDESLDNNEKMMLYRLTDDSDHVVISQPEELKEKLKTAESINASL